MFYILVGGINLIPQPS